MSAPIRKLTAAQIGEINAQNARQFMARHPEYYGSEYNSMLLWTWAESQVGTDYPIQLETLEAGLDYLQDELQQRPAEEPAYQYQPQTWIEQPSATLSEPDQRELKNMPLSALRVLANAQRHQLVGQKRATAQSGSESRQIGDNSPRSIQAEAEMSVFKNYPTLKRGSSEFSKRVAEAKRNLGAN
jgi:hypothetical protein